MLSIWTWAAWQQMIWQWCGISFTWPLICKLNVVRLFAHTHTHRWPLNMTCLREAYWRFTQDAKLNFQFNAEAC